METLIGLKGKDFAIVAADNYAQFSIYRMKDDEDKILEMDSDKLLGTAGPIGDRNQFGEYIRKNIHLYRLNNNYKLNCKASAHFTRQQLAYYLRRNPYQVDLILAGYDQEKNTPELYWFDYLASMVSISKGAHGYGAYFVNGILDRYFNPDLSEEEALEILKKCRDELKRRFIVSQDKFVVKIVDKNGIRHIKLDEY